MANQTRCRCRPAQSPQSAVSRSMETPAEPCVQRWPHPIAAGMPAQKTDPTLYYVRCALSYQNQTLAEIKTLLQQLVTAAGGEETKP